MKSPEQFDPKDPKYKKVTDLPEEKQDNFVNVEGGGFITKEAANYNANNKESANRLNKWYWAGGSRTTLEMLKGTGKMSEVDIAENDARIENKHRDEDRAAKIESEKYRAAKWAAFNKADSIRVLVNYSNGLRFKISVEDESGESFSLSFDELTEKGLLDDKQLASLFDFKVISGSIHKTSFDGKLKDGWEHLLEKIIGKKVKAE